MQLDQLTAALRNPSAYSSPPRHIELAHTHASLLFFADDRVYKVKKAVELGFLDFSTLERRRRFCEEEVRLNRRLAPDVYLGVVAITRGGAGRVRIGGEGGTGEVIDYAVEMVRLPAERMLDRLLESAQAGEAEVDAVARKLAEFHAAAATGAGIDEHGTPEAVAHHLKRNLGELRQFSGEMADAADPDGPVLSRPLWEHLHAWIGGKLVAMEALLGRRVEAGRIRDGHGDLHAGNICMLEEAGRLRPVIYDCIEFNPAFRCCDVASDLAFLGRVALTSPCACHRVPLWDLSQCGRLLHA